jgi:hypothetical protein
MGRSDSLYKYTRLEFVNSVLNNGIYASNLSALNDPYEGYMIGEAGTSNDYKVVCLSRSRNQKLMWSHYADGHKGCTIKITLPKAYGTEDCPLKRVKYSSKLLSKQGLSEKEMADSLYTKDKKWSKELEVRAVNYSGNQSLDCWKKTRAGVFYKVNIVQVDLGCLAHLDKHYLDALIAIRDYNANHKKKIKVRKYKMSDEMYQIVLDNEFDFSNELKKLTK